MSRDDVLWQKLEKIEAGVALNRWALVSVAGIGAWLIYYVMSTQSGMASTLQHIAIDMRGVAVAMESINENGTRAFHAHRDMDPSKAHR